MNGIIIFYSFVSKPISNMENETKLSLTYVSTPSTYVSTPSIVNMLMQKIS